MPGRCGYYNAIGGCREPDRCASEALRLNRNELVPPGRRTHHHSLLWKIKTPIPEVFPFWSLSIARDISALFPAIAEIFPLGSHDARLLLEAARRQHAP